MFKYGMSAKERGRAVIEVIMSLAQGREKRRFRSRSRHFNFCYITSANDSFESVIGSSATPATLQAISTRLSSIDLTNRTEGVLDYLPEGFSEKADFLGGLLSAAEKHHGVALPHMLAQLVSLVARDPDAFRERLLHHIADFRVKATRGAPRKASRRVLDAFGLVYAASRLAVRFDALPASFSPLESALACYHLHLGSTLPPARPVEIIAALLDDPEVRTLKRGQRLGMTKQDFEDAKAFKVVSPEHVELIMSRNSAERLFDDWMRVHKRDADVKRIIKREGSRPDTYRRIGKDERDRVVCFRIRPDWPFWRR